MNKTLLWTRTYLGRDPTGPLATLGGTESLPHPPPPKWERLHFQNLLWNPPWNLPNLHLESIDLQPQSSLWTGCHKHSVTHRCVLEFPQIVSEKLVCVCNFWFGLRNPNRMLNGLKYIGRQLPFRWYLQFQMLIELDRLSMMWMWVWLWIEWILRWQDWVMEMRWVGAKWISKWIRPESLWWMCTRWDQWQWWWILPQGFWVPEQRAEKLWSSCAIGEIVASGKLTDTSGLVLTGAPWTGLVLGRTGVGSTRMGSANARLADMVWVASAATSPGLRLTRAAGAGSTGAGSVGAVLTSATLSGLGAMSHGVVSMWLGLGLTAMDAVGM